MKRITFKTMDRDRYNFPEPSSANDPLPNCITYSEDIEYETSVGEIIPVTVAYDIQDFDYFTLIECTYHLLDEVIPEYLEDAITDDLYEKYPGSIEINFYPLITVKT